MAKISSRSVAHKPKVAKRLIKMVKAIIKNSYSPYSKLPVSAGIYCGSGKIYTGVNIENSSFSLTICAERVALYKALSEGENDFRLLLVYAPDVDYIVPCGACLQVLGEFAPDLIIASMNKNEKFKFYPLKTLLSKQFRL
jgi:cytidine deaminase